MRSLDLLDLSIIIIYLICIFAVGLYFSRRASQSTDHFFVGNRGLPWWSMVNRGQLWLIMANHG